MSRLLGGVETGGTWCVCAVGTGPGEILREEQFPTGRPEATIDRIVEFFALDPAPAAIGIGAFGPVDLDPASPTWGHVTTTPKPDWQHVSLAAPVRDRLAVPVAFDNDVDAAAVGERRWGAGRGAEALCYLTVGTGIGAGLLIGERPWHGLIHPEVGHMRIPRDPGEASFSGVCPVHGDCWEGIASGPAIERRWDTPPEELPDGHPAWKLEADYLTLGILAIVSVFSPDRVIVGGGVMDHGALLGMVRTRLPELIGGYLDTPLLGSEVDSFLVAPGLGDRAGVLGAMALAEDLL